MMKSLILACVLAALPIFAFAHHGQAAKRASLEVTSMELGGTSIVSNGFKWVDGRILPLEGKAFNDTEEYYDRLPADLWQGCNKALHGLKHHAAGMQFRFTTTSRKLIFRWKPASAGLSMGHMPATGVSGIDVYKFDYGKSRWVYHATGWGRYPQSELKTDWVSGTPCLVNLPLYNGIKEFTLGIEPGAEITRFPERKSGIVKPVVFYGTSITQGGCASRPGMAFVNIIGRDLDVPVVNLGFSGSGRMEYEMSDILARVDASCYVLDAVTNMGSLNGQNRKGGNVEENYEPFIRNLRAKRPDVPIVMCGQPDVKHGPPNAKDVFVKSLYDRLTGEGWRNLTWLPKTEMFGDCTEGTVDGCHANDLGMAALAKGYGRAVKMALRLETTR